MDATLQSILVQAVSILLPAVTTYVVVRLKKASRDIDAAFVKIRAHEQEMGIETHVLEGKINVAARPKFPKGASSDGSGTLRKKGGRRARKEAQGNGEEKAVGATT